MKVTASTTHAAAPAHIPPGHVEITVEDPSTGETKSVVLPAEEAARTIETSFKDGDIETREAILAGLTEAGAAAFSGQLITKHVQNDLDRIVYAIQANPKLPRDAKDRVLAELRRVHSGELRNAGTETSLAVLESLQKYGSTEAEIVTKNLLEIEPLIRETDDPSFWRAQFAGLNGEKRRRKIKELRGEIHKKHRELQRSQAEARRIEERKKVMIAACDELVSWMKGPLTIQRPESSAFTKLRQASIDGDVIITSSVEQTDMGKENDLEPMWREASTFLVEHDWARAFEKASGDVWDGAASVDLPDDICMFEFRISGRKVLVTAFKGDLDDETSDLCMMPAIETKTGLWLITGTICYRDGVFGDAIKGPRQNFGKWVRDHFEPINQDDDIVRLMRVCYDQIRCISIALEAEVAVTEVVRVPHRSNRPPLETKKSHGSFYAYHVVSLAHRSRAERNPDAIPGHTGRRMPLHFRRSHWRHYQTHKVKIKWMLVGDPEIGWIDKHYKL